MGVTDCLTGYEIKSDIDNYQRLESQIRFKIHEKELDEIKKKIDIAPNDEY